MTDPVLSSFAGRNPPNPVLAVTSGRPELEFDPETSQFCTLIIKPTGWRLPFNLLVLEVFLSVLFVMSGIDFLPRKLVSISVLEEMVVVEGVKLKQGTVVALK